MADDGTEDFLRLSKALKHAGHTELRKELNRGLKKAAKPLIAKQRAAALRQLPRAGGLAKQVAKEPMRVQVRTGNTAGVRVVVGKRSGGARAANRGVIRHPVFGTDVWVNQKVPGGWFDDTAKAEFPAIKRDVEQVIKTVAERVVREAKR